MNWLQFALKVPVLISGFMMIVQKVRGASGPDKKQAVLDALPESLELVEFGAGRDLFNDPVVAGLLSIYIDAEKVAMKAREALKAGILAKAPAHTLSAVVTVAP